MEKLFYCDVVCLALSVLGIFVMYAYDTVCVYMIQHIYAMIIMHALAYIALGCICLMIIITIITIIIAVIESKKNK